MGLSNGHMSQPLRGPDTQSWNNLSNIINNDNKEL